MVSGSVAARVAPACRRTARAAQPAAAAAAAARTAPLAASKSAVLAGAAPVAALGRAGVARVGHAARAGGRTPVVAQAASSDAKVLGVSVTTLKKARPRPVCGAWRWVPAPRLAKVLSIFGPPQGQGFVGPPPVLLWCLAFPPGCARRGALRSRCSPSRLVPGLQVVPLGFMFFCILFNYTILRDTKDVLVVTAPGSGAEIIPFLKTWCAPPRRRRARPRTQRTAPRASHGGALEKVPLRKGSFALHCSRHCHQPRPFSGGLALAGGSTPLPCSPPSLALRAASVLSCVESTWVRSCGFLCLPATDAPPQPRSQG